MTLRHRLAAIWFADLVGYSRLAAEDEEAALAGVRRLQKAAREVVARHDGRVVKLLGDGVLAEFDSTESAVRAGWRLVAGFGDDPSVRVGIHVGDVATAPDGDVYGSGVNVADRICEAAPAGAVAVSEDVQRQLRQRHAFRFEALGEQELKGVGRLGLYAVEVAETEEAEATAEAEAAGAAEDRPWPLRHPRAITGVLAASLAFGGLGLWATLRDGGRALAPAPAIADSAATGIAVLPFRVSGAAREEWRESMVDLLSTNLDAVPGIRAIESGTVMARWNERIGRDRDADAAAALTVAAETGARYAIRGQAVGIGSGVRLTAWLYDLQSPERPLGEGRVEGSADNLFELADQLTLGLLTHFDESDLGRPLVDLARVTTDSLEALKAYLEGEARFRRADFAGAFEAFQRAVEIDSTFALALYRQGVAAGWGGLGPATEYLERAARHMDRLPPREALVLRGTLATERGSLEAIELLEQATRRYPDDAGAWFELGEAYYHLGAQALLGSEESERPFATALELDPALSPAWIHRIEDAFGLAADRELARRRIDAFARLAPATTETGLYRLAWTLAFADAGAQRAAWSALDTLGSAEVRFVARNLFWHPTLLALQEAVLSRARHDDRLPLLLAATRMRRGRVAAAEADLAHPSVAPAWRVARFYQARAWGLPVSEEALDRVLAQARTDDSIVAFFAGARAAEAGRWPEHAVAVRTLEERAERHRQAGEPDAARFTSGAAHALQAYAAWRRGDRSRAAAGLAAGQREATGFSDLREAVNATIRLWLADLWREAGDPDREAVYLESFWGQRAVHAASAQLRLAGLHERAGRAEAARRAYAAVAAAWSEADSALRPEAERARERTGGQAAAKAGGTAGER